MNTITTPINWVTDCDAQSMADLRNQLCSDVDPVCADAYSRTTLRNAGLSGLKWEGQDWVVRGFVLWRTAQDEDVTYIEIADLVAPLDLLDVVGEMLLDAVRERVGPRYSLTAATPSNRQSDLYRSLGLRRFQYRRYDVETGQTYWIHTSCHGGAQS